LNRLILLMTSILFCHLSVAGNTDCGMVNVNRMYVSADRTDLTDHSNTVNLVLEGASCAGVDLAFLSNDHPAYDGILSFLLYAKSTNTKVRVVVNDNQRSNNAREITWVNF